MHIGIKLALLGIAIGLAGLVQAQSAPFRVKPSDVDATVKDPSKDLRETRTPGITPRNHASPTSKNLQNIERETAKKTPSGPKKASAVKPVKDTPSPKININGGSGQKAVVAQNRPASNPYKGRMKQKGTHHY
jgi:hypothetical protein